MNFPKTHIYPVMGLTLLAILVLIAYMTESVFLDRLLVCSFILLFVFIGKMRENANKFPHGSDQKIDTRSL